MYVHFNRDGNRKYKRLELMAVMSMTVQVNNCCLGVVTQYTKVAFSLLRLDSFKKLPEMVYYGEISNPTSTDTFPSEYFPCAVTHFHQYS
jgi:hypothetical protein